MNKDAKTFGFTFLKPGKALVDSSLKSIKVSPTGAPLISFIPATRYPTSPAESSFFDTFLGEKIPISSTMCY